jgi:hypothetical protein
MGADDDNGNCSSDPLSSCTKELKFGDSDEDTIIIYDSNKIVLLTVASYW